MIIAQSLWRKAIATVFAAAAFVSLYEVTMIDSKYAARQAMLRETTAVPAPGARLAFNATAYCKGVTTASGVAAQTGVAAADPQLLPVGSVDRDRLDRAALQRHLHDHGHRTESAGAAGGHLHVELPRSAAVRPPAGSPRGDPPRVESPCVDARLHGSDVHAAPNPNRCRPAQLPTPSDVPRQPLAKPLADVCVNSSIPDSSSGASVLYWSSNSLK